MTCSSADGFGNIVTDERCFDIAIDQWAARMLTDGKLSLPESLGSKTAELSVAASHAPLSVGSEMPA
jgi:hypothetical protein